MTHRHPPPSLRVRPNDAQGHLDPRLGRPKTKGPPGDNSHRFHYTIFVFFAGSYARPLSPPLEYINPPTHRVPLSFLQRFHYPPPPSTPVTDTTKPNQGVQ